MMMPTNTKKNESSIKAPRGEGPSSRHIYGYVSSSVLLLKVLTFLVVLASCCDRRPAASVLVAGFSVSKTRPAFAGQYYLKTLDRRGRNGAPRLGGTRMCSTSTSTTASTSDDATSTKKQELQNEIEDCIRNGVDPEHGLLKLEELNLTSEPNRSPTFFGEWHVWYTNCPPPSNGT